MKQKAFVLQNKGMNRDLSISKTGESSAYENHNIRILARDHDTLLSVTNERGNKVAVIHGLDAANLRVTESEEVRITENELYRVVSDNSVSGDVDFRGILIGWNVLNNNVILFTNEGTTDRIYHVWYEGGEFYGRLLFQGFLNFSINFPIESVVYHETDDIQKIYWVDGRNVLRFMNFMEQPDRITGLFPWQIDEYEYDNTYFDSNRQVDFGVNVVISKDNSGNTRANGVIQYLLTYYNKHGQESGYVWMSDLVYLSPVSSGGAADGTNNNSVTLRINGLDEGFSHFRIYSVFRSALNGITTAYIVFDGKTDGGSAIVVDNNSHLTGIDASSLLYLGSRNVVANTLTHKDQTLFLGDLKSVDRDYDEIERILKTEMIDQDVADGKTPWRSKYITFEYDANGIPNETNDDSYAYNNQLVSSSSQITSFKGGEKYRFALSFHTKDGSMTDAFWIGDAVNYKYPVISDTEIRRVIAQCVLPDSVVQMMKDRGYQTAQLMVAEATYADRSVKAQGIVCPTVFNVWNRYMNRLYSASSWMMRPRGAEYAWKHFEPIHNSTNSTGEIDCNYWSDEEATPNPYYGLNNYASNPEYSEEFDGKSEYSYAIIIYRMRCHGLPHRYSAGSTIILAKPTSPSFSPDYIFNSEVISFVESCVTNNSTGVKTYITSDCEYKIHNFNAWQGSGTGNNSVADAWTDTLATIRAHYPFFNEQLVNEATFFVWSDVCADNVGDWIYFNNQFSSTHYADFGTAVNNNNTNLYRRWYTLGEEGALSGDMNYSPAYYKKHLMFIDENVVTLNSPEISYEAISFDRIENHKFRIVGVAKIDSNYSDYTVYASPGKLPGENLMHEQLAKTLIAWPLWKEYGLDPRTTEENSDPVEEHIPEPDIKDRDSYDYIWGGAFVKYWLRMWNHADKISGYTDYENDDFSTLHNKTFANSRYSKKTIYNNYKSNEWSCLPDSIRIFNYTSSQYVGVDIGNGDQKQTRYYDGIINDSLSLPGDHKYPVLFSYGTADATNVLDENDCYLYQADPISITFSSTPHAVISLPTRIGSTYTQTILPYVNASEKFDNDTRTVGNTGRLIPWVKNYVGGSYPYLDYKVDQNEITFNGFSASGDDQYVFIGEIYSNLDDDDEIRYGGTTDSAIQNNRFLVAGPQYLVSDMRVGWQNILVADQGDTYIQRWDCLKTKPFSTGALNNVIDITSVMLETHINIDGRTDLQRGTSYIASIDTEKFGQINPVYSQHNNFIIQKDLDEDFNLDAYRSTITWTLEKHDSADVDEWSHITLASTLKLDGDKGICRALRRLQNSIIAFQDRGISEVLFNSRTQLTTTDGVPVEIANSGKVDGKRYITNKYGCTNKWSIVEGKAALYFVDNINKAFCAFNGQAIDNLSTKLGFGVWFREVNNLDPWRPVDFNNIVSYYDKVHSDIYLVRNTDDEMPCLVYNENLGAFTSFFDYSAVLMMANVEDRFLSFKNHRVWLQNEGLYGNFFGSQYGFWMQYRVTPDPYLDKIWTNVEYRADVYEVLDENGDSVVPEEYLINGDMYGGLDDTYKENESFTDYEIWNEYQETGIVPLDYKSSCVDPARKKFRIWRLTIPRALHKVTGKPSLDRIRNPWINVKFRKSNLDGRNLMQMHDFIIKYFE